MYNHNILMWLLMDFGWFHLRNEYITEYQTQLSSKYGKRLNIWVVFFTKKLFDVAQESQK